MLSVGILVVVATTNLLLGVAVIANNSRAELNRVFGSLAFTVAFWSIVTFLEDTSLNKNSLRLLATLDFGLAAIMIWLFFLFSAILSRSRFKAGRYLLLLIMLISVGLTIAGYTVSGVLQGSTVLLEPGPAFPVFLALLVACLGSGVFLLVRQSRRSRGIDRVQMQLILLGLYLTASALVVTNIILPRLYNDSSSFVSRIGIYSILFFTGFSTYAIVKHRFMNIRLLVARTVAYILLLVTLAGMYGAAIFGATAVFFPSETVGLAQKAVYATLAIILAFTFQPLRRFFEHLTDSIFFRDRYDTEEVLTDIGRILASEILLEKVLDKSLAEICQKLRVQRGLFMIFDKGKIYKVSHHGPLPDRLIIVPELKKLNRALIVSDELPPGERKDILDSHGLRLSLVLRTKDQFVGFLLLGDKLSGDIYSDQDLDLLQVLSHELAIAIVNAKAYEEISRFNATLQQKVLDATKRLRVANRNLKALDKAKDEFISMASHQLRTPLTTIKGYLSMILEGDAGKINAEQRDYLDFAFGGTQRMVSLISDLLNVSRLSAGRFVIEKQPTDMISVVEDEVRQLQTHAEAKSLKLSFDHPKKVLPHIELDEGKTRQVIMNFIDNAIYYTKEGSVTVTLDYDSKAGTMTVKVHDTGIGVPPEAQKKLFTKFFRADNAQTVRPDGTGLGLYLAKRVVEDQGGKILFESTVGQGSTFGFEMPLKTKEPNAKDHQTKQLPAVRPAAAVKR
ncbi:MAG TPA: ATP-binding protein [Candidatus Nanoarchaeia archaeon]|nr:ATP-binding protein [Candidatus Nanoarchaeia archaeon]